MKEGSGGALLVVDDDESFRERVAAALRSRGIPCETAADAAAACALAERLRPAGVLLDLRMPGTSGLDAIPELRQRLPEAVIVVLTGYGSIATAVEALRRGADDYLVKPTDVDHILAAFRTGPAGAAPRAAPPDDQLRPPTLGRLEWEHIQRVMNECGGNVSRAARVLGMHRRTLQRKLSKYPPKR